MSDRNFDAVLETSKRWMKAWMEQDRQVLEAILAPEYELVVSSIPTTPFQRQSWLETAVGPYVCTRFEYEGVHMHRIGEDVVVMSAIADFDATINGTDRSGRYWVTDIWRRNGANWLVSERSSGRPGEADASVRAMADAQAR